MNKKETPRTLHSHPVCRSKCLYCEFYSVASPAAIPEWLNAFKELLLYKEKFQVSIHSTWGRHPAILAERELAALLGCVHKHFTFCSGSEMTMEANPDGLSGDS